MEPQRRGPRDLRSVRDNSRFIQFIHQLTAVERRSPRDGDVDASSGT